MYTQRDTSPSPSFAYILMEGDMNRKRDRDCEDDAESQSQSQKRFKASSTSVSTTNNVYSSESDVEKCTCCLDPMNSKLFGCPNCKVQFHMGCAFKHWIMSSENTIDVSASDDSESNSVKDVSCGKDPLISSVCPTCRGYWRSMDSFAWLDECSNDTKIYNEIREIFAEVLSEYSTIFHDASQKTSFSESEIEDLKKRFDNYKRINQFVDACYNSRYVGEMQSIVSIPQFLATNRDQVETTRKLAIVGTFSGRVVVHFFASNLMSTLMSIYGNQGGNNDNSESSSGSDNNSRDE